MYDLMMTLRRLRWQAFCVKSYVQALLVQYGMKTDVTNSEVLLSCPVLGFVFSCAGAFGCIAASSVVFIVSGLGSK
jgi:hypothetical protein